MELLQSPDGRRYDYRLARLVTTGNRWYVVYYVWDYSAKRLIRVRDYSCDRQGSEAAKRKAGNAMMKEINALLVAGYVANVPLEKIGSASLSSALEVALAHKKKTIKPNSYRYYITTERLIAEFLAGENPTAEYFFTHAPQKFLDFVLAKGVGNKTYNNYLTCMKALGAEMIRRGLISRNKFQDMPELSVQVGRHIVLDEVERKAILDRAGEKYPDLVQYLTFLYFTFARPHSVRALKISDVRETIRIDAATQKTGKTYHILVPPALRKVIEEMKLDRCPPNWYVFGKSGQPGPVACHRDYFYARHATILQELGLEKRGYDLYSYKHTGVVALWKKTQDIELISRQCGHFPNIQTTLLYLRQLGLDYSKLAAKLRDFDW